MGLGGFAADGISRSVMRIVGLVTVGLLMGLGLAGCGQTPAPTQQVAQAVPPAPACNCGDKAAPDNHLTRLSYIPRHRRHHREHGYHGSYTSRSEEAVQSYGYVSASRVSYSKSTYSGGYDEGPAHEGYERDGHRYYRGKIVWVDGYGRGYFAGQRPTVAQTMNGKRMSVGHGYDADCPEGYGQDGY
jgi:hypothetical protein